MERTSLRATAVMAAAALALVAGPARQAGAHVFAAVPPGTYATPAGGVVRVGAPVTFVNLDGARHNVVALDATRPANSAPWCTQPWADGCPLFYSELVGLGETAQVLGLARADVGVPYGFYCTLHPWMRGTLVVAS